MVPKMVLRICSVVCMFNFFIILEKDDARDILMGIRKYGLRITIRKINRRRLKGPVKGSTG